MASHTARPDFRLAIAPSKLSALADEFARLRRLRIHSALNPAAAEALHCELAESHEWSRTMRLGKAEREITANTLVQLSPKHLEAMEQFARQGDDGTFRFMHDAIRIPADAEARRTRSWAIDCLVDELNSSETLALIRALTREPVNRFCGDATRYLSGHFLTTHNDGRKFFKRVLALVLNLSPHWHLDWGGVLLFHDIHGDVACGWTPQFNTISLFSVPQNHSVSQVTPLAAAPRYAIAGWFYSD